MNELIHRSASALLDDAPPCDRVGPDTASPWLAFRLDGGDERLAARLRDLPCVVIGIGDGALSAACDIVLPCEARLPMLAARIERAPLAAMILVQHLRASAGLAVRHALVAESLAYATVQAGPDFRRWQAHRPAMPAADEDGPPLLVEREDGALRITMNRARTFNAIGVAMRDALCEALDLALIDPDIGRVVLTGAGRCFSIGGDVREFGLAPDPATAHWIRSLRLPAARLADLADRLEVRIDGGAVGAGIEMAAFARRIVATPRAWFQLPELDYGLIPGAGGTVGVPRRIGRQAACELMVSGRRVRAREALAIGLIDAIEP